MQRGAEVIRHQGTGEAARRLGISRHALLRAVRRGDLSAAHRTPGGHLQFDSADIDAYSAQLASAATAAARKAPGARDQRTRMHLAAIVEASDDAIISRLLDGTIVTWNKGAERLYGYTATEAVGRPVTMLIPPEVAHEWPMITARLEHGEQIAQYHTVRRHKHGELVAVSLSIAPLRDGKGRIIGVVATAHDLRAREQARLNEAMARVSDALSGAIDPARVYGVILEQAATVMPCDHMEIVLYQDGWATVAANWGEPVVPANTRLFPCAPSIQAWLALEDGVPLYLPDTATAKGWRDTPPWVGKHRLRSVLAVPLRIQGEVLGAFLACSFAPRTCSEQHKQIAAAFADRATQALRNARLYQLEQERARAAEELARIRHEQAEEAMVLAEVGAILASTLEPAQLYERVLDQALRLLPYDHANVAVYDAEGAMVMASRGRPHLLPGTRAFSVLAVGRGWQPETTDRPVHLPDATAVPGWEDIAPWTGPHAVRSMIWVPLQVDGRPVGSFKVMSTSPHRYTERHVYLAGLIGERVAQALRNVRLYAVEQERARAAEDLARVRNDFLGAVSHELRTPLAAIIGYAELLTAHWGRLDDPQRLERLGRIVLAADRQRRLVEDLLLSSRVEAGMLHCDRTCFALRPMLERGAEEMQASYREQRVVLQGPDLMVLADAHRTLQIAANLMDNAAKYSPESSPVEVTWAREGELVAVRVVDRGPGIPESDRARLFTRFGRLAGSRARAGRVGTGLGLYLSRLLAGAMEGSLELEQSGPEGSTFRLCLPAWEQAQGS